MAALTLLISRAVSPRYHRKLSHLRTLPNVFKALRVSYHDICLFGWVDISVDQHCKKVLEPAFCQNNLLIAQLGSSRVEDNEVYSSYIFQRSVAPSSKHSESIRLTRLPCNLLRYLIITSQVVQALARRLKWNELSSIPKQVETSQRAELFDFGEGVVSDLTRF